MLNCPGPTSRNFGSQETFLGNFVQHADLLKNLGEILDLRPLHAVKPPGVAQIARAVPCSFWEVRNS